MRSLLISVLSLTFALAAIASSSLSPWTLHEKRSHIPAGWSQTRKYHSSATIPLRFALTQNNIDDIERHLYDVSHPDSPNYGKHWTARQIAAKFAPSSESIDTVFEWLLQSGVDAERVKLSPTKGWIEVTSTVEEAEDLLRTEYHVYGHESGKEHVACDSYHLPAHVTPHVDFVTPTIHFDAKLTKGSVTRPIPIGQPGEGISPKTSGEISSTLNSTELETCDKQITPSCLRALYGLIYEPVAGDKNSYGIVQYTPQAYIQSDLDSFARKFSTGLEGKPPVMVSIDGGVDQMNTKGRNYNGESNLDLEYSMTLVTDKQNVTLYQVGDIVEGASFNYFLDALDGTYCTFDGGDDPSSYPDEKPNGYKGKDCGIVNPPNVVSTSYGYNEADLSVKYVVRQCNEYAKLGLLGVTFLYSSGDYGVAGSGGGCLNPDGVQNSTGKIFSPSFPASCPYVTAVGATQVNAGQTVSDPESACEKIIYSGGGFSNYFAMPDYQKDAVTGYLRDHPPAYPSSIWNSTGGSRAYPDLSANGANYIVAIDGSFSLVFGTSAASPVVGAILTMVNDARIAIGKSPIGFINPAIYSSQFSGGFNDITNGTNQGCGTLGFNSSEGWDPVTGLGTPRFPVLLEKWLMN
ncbi:subtilisin-like protein [Leucogyrophana mollusca]|uniref:Subtilisin-like protein n=1 Tax=Leucogyrophana mollusca TaxID=85980 RepID=A0ACB8BD64_9AGAM|nr:subtilisin-like protein [Leucogyrophana mollusca]